MKNNIAMLKFIELLLTSNTHKLDVKSDCLVYDDKIECVVFMYLDGNVLSFVLLDSTRKKSMIHWTSDKKLIKLYKSVKDGI